MAKINVVIGPPCGGKSTHVKDNAGTGDVIVDFDLLAQAFGASEHHSSAGSVREVSFTAREAAIRKILGGVPDNAWIIHTSPTRTQLGEYSEVGAELILVDPGKSACLERVASDQRPARTVEDIENWYANPPLDAVKNATQHIVTGDGYTTILRALTP